MSPPRLAEAPFPLLGEHPAGYHRRLAVANGFSTLRQMRLVHGIGSLSPRSGEEAWSLLQAATDLPSVRLRPLSWPAIDGAIGTWLDVCGKAIRLRDLDFANLRHCPLCLAEDGILRVEWSLRMVTSCPVHAIGLVDGCSGCGRPLALDHRTDIHACRTCGTDMLKSPTHQADPNSVSVSRLLAEPFRPSGAASDVDLPQALIELPVGDRAAVLARLAHIRQISADAPASASVVGRRPPRIPDAAIEAAAVGKLLRDWPHSFLLMLMDTVLGSGHSMHRTAQAPAIRLVLQPLRSIDGAEIRFLADPARDLLSGAFGIEARQRAPGSKPIDTGDRTHYGLPVSPISHAAAMTRLEGRPDVALAKWWIRAGLLTEHAAADGVVLSREQVGELSMRLEEIASSNPVQPSVDARWIDRSLTAGREYRKDRLLLDLFEGRATCWRNDERPGLAGLLFDRSALLARRAEARIENWIVGDHRVALSPFNSAATLAWGPGCTLQLNECDELAARGDVECTFYDPPTPGAWRQKRWSVAGLARHARRKLRSDEH